MGRTRTPRKPHKRKPVITNTREWATAGVMLLDQDKQERVLTLLEGSIQAIADGNGVRNDYETVARAFNIGKALAELNVGNNLLPVIQQAADALYAFGTRMASSSDPTTRATDAELDLIVNGAQMYRIQLSLCTQGEIERALKIVVNVITSGAARYVVHEQQTSAASA